MTTASHEKDIACSLNDKQFSKRREMLRNALFNHVVYVRRLERGLKLDFEESSERRAAVEQVIDLEKQCCGFLSFTISPPGEGLSLSIEGPLEAQPFVHSFMKRLEKP